MIALACFLAAPGHGRAFCGFYVSGAEGSLYANATMVVMMREGQRTVLSMQNDYRGPPEDFAMVVPVPVVLSEDDVRTLPREIFGAVDRLAAPRLVEYWEDDPCNPRRDDIERLLLGALGGGGSMSDVLAEGGGLGVTIEAEFAVGEYDIVILSASDSSGLETWLHREHYNIPEGASEVLRPYVEAGTKFFVARVDVERVTFETDASGARRALLSPLRVHYDSPEFSLPVRLGLLNSGGQQDLIVHILARGQRYEVANYDNALIPTNIVVGDGTRHEFGAFYEWLFRRTLEQHPRAVVTEYAWAAATCDPCPGDPLTPQQLTTLGADVIPGSPYDFVLTRLHYRYSAEDLGEDLVFRTASPIEGGRGIPTPEGVLSQEVTQTSMDQFQGRYVILNRWEGEVACESPQRGRWGGPPSGPAPPIARAGSALLGGGVRDASAGERLIAVPVPAIGASPAPSPAAPAAATPAPATPTAPDPTAASPVQTSSCSGCALAPRSSGSIAIVALAGLALVRLVRRRKRRSNVPTPESDHHALP